LAGFIAALPILFLAGERLRGEWLLFTSRKQLVAGGEKLTVEELTPRVPDGMNVVLLTPTAAVELLRLDGRQHPFPGLASTLEPGRAVVGWRKDQWVDRDGVWRTWDDYLESAQVSRARLPGLRDQLAREIPRVHLDYLDGFDILLPHLAAYRAAAMEFAQAAMYELHTGNLEAAQANLQAMARLADSLATERLLISQLVRVALTAVAREALWAALQADAWTDDQLALLQADWEEVRFTADMLEAINMERAMNRTYFPGRPNSSRAILVEALERSGSGLLDSIRSGSQFEQWRDALGEVLAPVLVPIRIKLYRHVWAPHDERFLIQATQEVLDLGRHAVAGGDLSSIAELVERGTNRHGAPLRMTWLQEQDRPGLRYLASSRFLPALGSPLRSAVIADAWNRVMVTAIALKRFELSRGQLPEHLGMLEPAFLDEAPVDWMDGHPLRYRLLDEGRYRLYSIGSDGVDHGGDAAFLVRGSTNWHRARDFVWPDPATDEQATAQDAEVAAQAAAKRKEGRQVEADKGYLMKRYGLLVAEDEETADQESDSPD
jgi:hypothetical protein